ncbi:hypothetical protein PPL19_05345 [Pseudomonas psychrotolerans L19]|nr:hypothetical protein [Pseudomonas psychrotolerans]EHK72338.1 hypothetical protein PPL19_05345 [Pseudomonas psychrotolerans L19]MBA1179574.1 hypothetical protein [Pseudomonas psychrotolerans]MBA1212177.1 hypothetical protein [Pseudomonas psychrotolerans]MBA1213391.1 hypothetical protein [Pseudomonas psychrotolerans]
MSAQVLLHPAVLDRAQVSAIQLKLSRRAVIAGHRVLLVPCRALGRRDGAETAANLLRIEGELFA